MSEYFNISDRMIVVDNFYKNPDMVRQHALTMERNDSNDGNYAGIMTKESFLTQEHLDTFGELLGEKVFPSTIFTGKFRFTVETDVMKQDIHFDPGDNNSTWAGVLYLTPDVEGVDGTRFWRHKRTGLEEIPRTLEGIQEYGWNGADDLKVFLETEGVDYSLWDQTFSVPYRYNRLIMFRPWMFHSPGPAFGDAVENCRLIQTFFWTPMGEK